MMEIQLAEELGVSRTPVREAIRKLELERFVVMLPRRGTYVANLSLKDINEVFEIRAALDGLAAGLAAERITVPPSCRKPPRRAAPAPRPLATRPPPHPPERDRTDPQ